MWHDVFLSFRGVEIRKTFISHLSSSLKKNDITAFTDPEPSSFDLHAHIETSEVAIIVISKNYKSLDWLFSKVVTIIECEKIGTLKTVPVLYQVEPSRVLKWLGHTKTYRQLNGTQREKLEKVKKWLGTHLTNKSCFKSLDWVDDSELVDNIARFISDILISSTSSNQSRGLTPNLIMNLENVGLSSHPSNMLTLNVHSSPGLLTLPPISNPHVLTTHGLSACLAYRNRDLRRLMLDAESTTIGICGLEGVGKTNLAKQVSEEISPQFQHNFFMSNFRNKVQQQDSSYKSSLLLNFACESLKGCSFTGSSDDTIKEMIGHRKVLFVVDDVDDVNDLKSIVKEASRFGPGNRVIVITQDRSLLTQCGVKHIYEVECPKDEESLAFFSEFAFGQRNPLLGFEALSFRAVQVSNHLPLALKMLGSFLRDKEKSEWVSTLRKLEASHNNYATEVCRRIGAEYAPRRPIKVDQHIGIDEANVVPFYRFSLK